MGFFETAIVGLIYTPSSSVYCRSRNGTIYRVSENWFLFLVIRSLLAIVNSPSTRIDSCVCLGVRALIRCLIRYSANKTDKNVLNIHTESICKNQFHTSIAFLIPRGRLFVFTTIRSLQMYIPFRMKLSGQVYKDRWEIRIVLCRSDRRKAVWTSRIDFPLPRYCYAVAILKFVERFNGFTVEAWIIEWLVLFRVWESRSRALIWNFLQGSCCGKDEVRFCRMLIGISTRICSRTRFYDPTQSVSYFVARLVEVYCFEQLIYKG